MSRVDYVAVIPARGGSKGLARKNLRALAGRPLIAHTIRAAQESGVFGRVLVSSEDAAMLEEAQRWGAEPLLRPAALAADASSSVAVVTHALRECGAAPPHYALLQPTSPLRSGDHIAAAVAEREKRGARSLVSVTESEHPPHKTLLLDDAGNPRPLFDWKDLTTPRQALPRTFRVNGAIYLGECQRFLDTEDLFAAPLALFAMTAEASVDIDSERDLQLAEFYLRGAGA